MTAPQPLTDQERTIYTLLYETTRKQGFQPSIRELAGELGWSAFSFTHRQIDMVRAKGWITFDHQAKRSIRFLYRPDGKQFTGFSR